MRKKKRVSIAIKLFVVLFALYSAVQLVSLQVKISAKKQEQEDLKLQLEQQKTYNDRLEDMLNSGYDEDYIASLAREKFGYGYSGEQVYIDQSSK
ncbi:MAG: septum formation initiator family protein [Clostridia bacterium]|nr:septum formation initiator family protein [Clostridia bacterium]